jgi:hypothetical protein
MMRYLHIVAAHELFVASGEYRYWRDDEALKVVEKWTIHELKGGAFLYRVDEDGRDEDGLNILSEALINPERQFERFNVQSFNPKDAELKDFKADYTFNPDYVQIGRRVQKQEHVYAEFSLMEGALIYIKQTLYMGLTISHIEAKGGQSEVFAPQLLASGDNQLQKIIVKERDTELVDIGRRKIEARKFQIADDVFYWLDEHNIPIMRQYSYDGAIYTAKVANYAHR